jgi:hypothetical protein
MYTGEKSDLHMREKKNQNRNCMQLSEQSRELELVSSRKHKFNNYISLYRARLKIKTKLCMYRRNGFNFIGLSKKYSCSYPIPLPLPLPF